MPGLFEKLQDALQRGRLRGILTEDLTDDTNDVLLNVVRSRTVNRGSSVTQHAVEEGAPVTDNKKNNPLAINLDVLIADNLELINLGIAFFISKKIRERREQLVKWWTEATVLWYVHDQIFESIVIESLNETANKGEGQGLSFSIGLKQIVIAEAVSGLQDKGVTLIPDDGVDLSFL